MAPLSECFSCGVESPSGREKKKKRRHGRPDLKGPVHPNSETENKDKLMLLCVGHRTSLASP